MGLSVWTKEFWGEDAIGMFVGIGRVVLLDSGLFQFMTNVSE
jgi:hypothetical protein